MFYSIITTIITAWETDVFAKDVVKFIVAIKDGVTAIGRRISVVAIFVVRLDNIIP